MSLKMATPGLLKITVFLNKGYDVLISVNDVTSKVLSRDSNYIVDVFCDQSSLTIAFLWEKLSRSQFYKDLTKNHFFEGCPGFKFNNLGLALGTNLKVYTSLSKGLKLKVKTFWWLILTFVEVTGKKLLVETFLSSVLPILNRVISEKYFRFFCLISFLILF